MRAALFLGLLHDVRQLMRQETPSGLCSRRELASAEYYVVSDGIGAGVDLPGRLLRHRAGVHSHPRKVVAEARFEEIFRRRLERLSRTAEHLMDEGWNSIVG